MAEPKIMTREQTFRFVEDLYRAALSGLPPPENTTGCEQMLSEDMGDALADFTRKLAERLNDIPSRISNDIEAQEIAQQRIDRIMSRIATVIETTVSVRKP